MALGRLSNRGKPSRLGSRLAVELAPRHSFYDWCNEILAEAEFVPDHTTLSVTRSRLPIEVHHAVFGFVLEIVERHDLVRGRRIGVDASTQAANAALRRLVRRDTGEDYRQMLERLAEDSGIE